MSQLTPNYNLILLEDTDPLADFRTWYNATLNIIDANLGGSSGHTIIDPSGTDMPQENGLQFTGNVNVTDDSVNGKTIIDIPASMGSGHTIINPNGTSMTQRSGLKFTGNVSVTDDSVNDETIVNISGGGGGSVNYSTTEQVGGTWIDGKPWYYITVAINTAQNSGALTINTGILNVDELISINGMASYSSGGENVKWLPLPFADDNQQVANSNSILKINSFIKTTGIIYGFIGSDYQGIYAINRIRLTLKYTKTTD